MLSSRKVRRARSQRPPTITLMTSDIQTKQERAARISDKLEKIPTQIEHVLTERLNDETERDVAYDELKEVERKTEHAVLWETDEETGKPKFTNQSMRDNEKARRLGENITYQQIKERHEKLGRRVEQWKHEFEVLKYRFRAAQSQAELESSIKYQVVAEKE